MAALEELKDYYRKSLAPRIAALEAARAGVAQQDRKALGEVREIAPQADPATRTRRVRIALADPSEAFRLGTTVTAYPAAEAVQGIELPASALHERDGKTLVWVIDPATQTVSTREVHVSARNGQFIRIAEGLAPGVHVVTAGVNSLTPGQQVKIADEASQ